VSVAAKVAGQDGREYTWLSSGGLVVAYVLPTTVGDSAIVCQGPTYAARALQACGALATEARASGETFMKPGPDTKLAIGIADALKQVATARGTLGGLTGQPTMRAHKADRVAQAEAQAVNTLGRLTVPVRYRAPFESYVSALRYEASQFKSLATVANRDRRSAFPNAVKGVEAASLALAGASNRLGAYHLGVASLDALTLNRVLPLTNTPQVPPPTPPPPTTTSPPPTTTTTPPPPPPSGPSSTTTTLPAS
jgi:hypothetical protein